MKKFTFRAICILALVAIFGFVGVRIGGNKAFAAEKKDQTEVAATTLAETSTHDEVEIIEETEAPETTVAEETVPESTTSVDTIPEETTPDVPEETDPEPTEDHHEEPAPTEPKPTTPAPTEPEPTEPPHEHKYNANVVAATCTTDGYTKYECSCGDEYKNDVVSAIGHSFVNGTCSVCGEEDPNYVEPTTEPPHEHDFQVVDVIKPTCSSEGYTTFKCECGEKYNGEKQNRLAHDFHEGHCENCGESDPDYVPPTEPAAPAEPADVYVHVCDHSAHAEDHVGYFTYVYCITVTKTIKSADGFTIYRPYAYYAG